MKTEGSVNCFFVFTGIQWIFWGYWRSWRCDLHDSLEGNENVGKIKPRNYGALVGKQGSHVVFAGETCRGYIRLSPLF